jgi:hypothetical protein
LTLLGGGLAVFMFLCAVFPWIQKLWRKDFRADLAAPSHQKTLRRDYFRAIEVSFPFSEPLTANSPNRIAASVAVFVYNYLLNLISKQ